MRLFHFSDDPAIDAFVPRPVAAPSQRGPGRDWLNGPLVWAIEEVRQAMYLFPRDCPRILLWPTPSTTEADRAQWFGTSGAHTLAYVERDWLEGIGTGIIDRYEMPPERFESLDDAGMWVSREAVTPIGRDTITDMPAALAKANVEVRALDRLTPLKGAWNTSLHASGIRLRNAQGWT